MYEQQFWINLASVTEALCKVHSAGLSSYGIAGNYRYIDYELRMAVELIEHARKNAADHTAVADAVDRMVDEQGGVA